MVDTTNKLTVQCKAAGAHDTLSLCDGIIVCYDVSCPRSFDTARLLATQANSASTLLCCFVALFCGVISTDCVCWQSARPVRLPWLALHRAKELYRGRKA